MKRNRILGAILMALLIPLASCGLLAEESSSKVKERTSKSDSTSIPSQASSDTSTTTTIESTTIKYSVIFDSKGGTAVESQEIQKGGKAVKPTDPEKEGYTFGGWYTSVYYSTQYNFDNNVTRNLTLYAKWNEIPKVVNYEVGTSSIYIWTNSINSRWMKIAIPVTNTGTADLYLDSSSVDIESSTGQLLQTKSYISGYPEYIKPGETGYYYVETTCGFTEENVVVVPHVEVEKATNDVIRYAISDVTFTEDTTYGGIKIVGRVTNNTSKKGSLVKLAANLYDSNGDLICTCYTYLENDLSAGSKIGFTITPYSYRSFAPSDIASYEIYAYPTQYNW